MKSSYDIVIIGAGIHGLATAYYLAKLGVTDVAVVDAKFVGYGGSGRNTAILRSNYRTAEGIRFYDESMKLWENLSQELNFNLMFSQQGHITLGHSTSTMITLTTRAEMNKSLGVDSEMLTPKEVKELLPDLDISDHPRYPVLGALYHPPGAIIRHDAVVWAYAKEAKRLGIEILEQTKVEQIDVENGKIRGVETNRGTISCNKLFTAVAGWSSGLARHLGISLPLVTYPLQALVTESYKPWLHHIVVSSNLHIYMSQTDRGELVCGDGIDGYPHHGMRSTLNFMEQFAAHVLELFPILHDVRVQRQWAGLCDMTPDYSPIISPINEVEGLYMNCGWGTYGFKAGPGSGKNSAKMLQTGEAPEVLKPFSLDRFRNNRLVGEKAAASVSA